MWSGDVRTATDTPHLYDCGILFVRLDKLVACNFSVFIAIHADKHPVHPLFMENG